MNDEEKVPTSKEKTSHGLWAAIVLLIVAVVISLGYAMYEQDVTGNLSTANREAEQKLAETGQQIQMMSQKLNKIESAEAAANHPTVVSNGRASEKASHASHRPRVDRYKKLEAQLAEHQKEIDSTQQALDSTRSEFQSNLDSAKNDLGGSIAKTHAELEVLEKKGERKYYEFDIAKSKRFNRAGPVGIKLRKANTKHQYADLELIVNDREVTKKHINIYEPVVFYPGDSEPPIQLVINGIRKNVIRGYVSTPKYTASDLATTSPNPTKQETTTPDAAGLGKVSRNTNSPAAPAAQPATPVELNHRPAVN